ISIEDAAALPEVLFTVWHNLFQRGALKKEEEVLVYGGSGGIGSMAIQLASRYGARVTTLAGSAKKAKYCEALGAKKIIQYKEQNLMDELPRESMDVILDSLGGAYFDINLE